jgi:hypothetical protein
MRLKKTLYSLLLASSLLLVSCSEEGVLFSKNYVGTGEVVTNIIQLTGTETISDFSIKLGNIMFGESKDFEGEVSYLDVNFYDYGEPRVEVITNQNIFDHLTYKVSDSAFELTENTTDKYVTNTFTMNFYGISISEATLEGASHLANSLYAFEDETRLTIKGATTGTLNLENVDNFSLDVKGTATLKLENLSLDYLKNEVTGVASLSGSGSIDKYEDSISGVATMAFSDIKTKEFYINSRGAANYIIAVSDILDIKSSGTLTVKYKGNPALTTQVAGAYDVSKIDN